MEVSVGPGVGDCIILGGFEPWQPLNCTHSDDHDFWHTVVGPCPSPPPPPPGPPPPPIRSVTEMWAKFRSLNCYFGHGADVQIDDEPCGTIDVEACARQCESFDGACQGITVVARANASEPVDCYRRSGIDLNTCEDDADFDTWVRSSWTLYDEFNCHDGAGGVPLDDGKSVGNVTREDCWASCSSHPECTAVVLDNEHYGPHPHQPLQPCFRMKEVELSECEVQEYPHLKNTWLLTPLPTFNRKPSVIV